MRYLPLLAALIALSFLIHSWIPLVVWLVLYAIVVFVPDKSKRRH